MNRVPRLTALLVLTAAPLGSISIVLTVGLVALGDLFTSPRMYEYIGALAPKGQQGLFLGYANLPLAVGALVSGFAGAFLFNERWPGARSPGPLRHHPVLTLSGTGQRRRHSSQATLACLSRPPLALHRPRRRGALPRLRAPRAYSGRGEGES